MIFNICATYSSIFSSPNCWHFIQQCWNIPLQLWMQPAAKKGKNLNNCSHFILLSWNHEVWLNLMTRTQTFTKPGVVLEGEPGVCMAVVRENPTTAWRGQEGKVPLLLHPKGDGTQRVIACPLPHRGSSKVRTQTARAVCTDLHGPGSSTRSPGSEDVKLGSWRVSQIPKWQNIFLTKTILEPSLWMILRR